MRFTNTLPDGWTPVTVFIGSDTTSLEVAVSILPRSLRKFPNKRVHNHLISADDEKQSER